MADEAQPISVMLEVTPSRTFASALDWPGWSRGGKTEDAAVAALLGYAPRYAQVAARAGEPLPILAGRPDLQVVERVPGDGATSFGVPAKVTELDLRPVTSVGAERLAALVRASWDTLADVADRAPAALRKGPRGGGRDRDAVVAHVEDAERSYARRIGLRPASDLPVVELRDRILEVIRLGADGGPLPGGTWPLRYAARRVAWHVLDHAWEIEDRSGPLA